ncbi:MAG: PQQ-binding-like beta-propeller repeat protein [Verrucomicrobia bacterium]|nr:PQQ-binding-like beta-propeller repeat protein [Verrucomicrobiota bacterium]
MPARTHPFALVLILTLWPGAGNAQSAEHWSNWRGPAFSGSVSGGRYPTRLDESQVRWTAPLPGKGCSTPIVHDRRIYLTAPVDGKDALLAFDWDGRALWQAVLGSETPGRHRNGSGSNPSTVTDGRSVYVHFKSGHLAAIDLAGRVRWQINLVERYGAVNLYWDHGSSPVLTARDVVVTRLHQGESWIAAFDQASGALRWKTPRNYEVPREVDQGYTTPQVLRHEGREAVLTWGAEHVTLHDAADGKLLWSCGGFNPTAATFWPAVASPVIAGDLAVVCFGRADRGTPRLHGVRLGGQGDVTASHRVWTREDTGAFVPTPALHQGRLYVLSDRGQLDCLDPATGTTQWSGSFPRTSSNFYASPLIAGDLLYAVREDGSAYVARIEGRLEILSEHKFPDRIIASMIAVEGSVIVRGEKNLYCLAAPQSSPPRP